MPALLGHIETAVSVLRQFGLVTLQHSLSYWLRYAYWQRKCETPAGSPDPSFLGELLQWQPITGDGNQAGTGLDLRCAGGTLRLEFLAGGLARVRLSRDGVFTPVRSYALDPARSALLTGLPFQMNEDAAPDGTRRLQLAGPDLGVQITHSPCRLTFTDAAGQVLFADAGGAGWQESGVTCSQRLMPGQELYGLGEKAFGLNHRGRRLIMWNRDPSGYGPAIDPLYQSTPFLLSRCNGLAFGILFDNTYRAEFDLGHTDPDTLHYRADGGELCYYVLAGPGLADVVRRYVDLTGHMALPPRWALGYHQSRWSYGSEAEVREVAQELRARHIPCDAIHLDIDHMRGYRVFTWDQERFPDPARLIADLRSQGLRTVTIQDPGIKADGRYTVCTDGLDHDVFCRLPDGQLLQGPVWPGLCYFPDFSNAEVRRWWGDHYRSLLEAGVAGFWNDMNEPVVFFSFTFPDAVRHRADAGLTDHRELHNVYGQFMAQASYEGLRRWQPDERPLVISRSAYAGLQRYACAWTGDNQSTWADLRLSIPMVLNLGLCGLAFAGPDTGGFAGDCGGELLARWTQVGAFLPWFRNHTAIGTARQEPWAFGEPYESICRRYIELHYRLLPYSYTAFWQAAESGLPVTRPLALAFPHDQAAAGMDDEYLYGDAILVAPVMAPDATGRPVYFPAGSWYDFWTGACIGGPGRQTVSAPLEVLPLYVREGSVVPWGPAVQYSDESVPEYLTLHAFPGNGVSVLYEDDGHSYAYTRGERRLTRFTLRSEASRLVLTREAEGDYNAGYSGYEVVLRGIPTVGAEATAPQPSDVVVDGVPVDTWTRDDEWHVPLIRVGMFRQIEMTW